MDQPGTIDEPQVGRPSAADVYADRFAPLVQLAYLLTLDGDEARDIVQECFAAAIGRWDAIEDHPAYLRRAVTNRSYNATRDRRRRADKADRHGRALAAAPAEPVEYLADAIAALPERERAIVVLRYYLDLQNAEVAAWLDIPVGSVGPTLGRALRRLGEDVDR